MISNPYFRTHFIIMQCSPIKQYFSTNQNTNTYSRSRLTLTSCVYTSILQSRQFWPSKYIFKSSIESSMKYRKKMQTRSTNSNYKNGYVPSRLNQLLHHNSFKCIFCVVCPKRKKKSSHKDSSLC